MRISDWSSDVCSSDLELDEELGIAIDVTALSPVAFSTAADDALSLVLLLFASPVWRGVPRPLDAAALRWCTIDALPLLPMPPAAVQFTAPQPPRLSVVVAPRPAQHRKSVV